MGARQAALLFFHVFGLCGALREVLTRDISLAAGEAPPPSEKVHRKGHYEDPAAGGRHVPATGPAARGAEGEPGPLKPFTGSLEASLRATGSGCVHVHPEYHNVCDYFTGRGITCATLERDYGFNCTGCTCSVETGRCPYHEFQGSEVNCDYLYWSHGWYCEYLEEIGYDCSGCACPDRGSCPLQEQWGSTCDYWAGVTKELGDDEYISCNELEDSWHFNCTGCSACDTPEPTASPTPQPTEQPTLAPTKAPTPQPTEAPTTVTTTTTTITTTTLLTTTTVVTETTTTTTITTTVTTVTTTTLAISNDVVSSEGDAGPGPAFGDFTTSMSTSLLAHHDATETESTTASTESTTTAGAAHDVGGGGGPAGPGGFVTTSESSSSSEASTSESESSSSSTTSGGPAHDMGGGPEVGSASNAAIYTTTWGFAPVLGGAGSNSDAGAGGAVGAPSSDLGGTAKGDPHLVNIKGEAFDVRQPGKYTFLRVPQDRSQPSLLAVRARVEPDWREPCSMLITHVEVSGSWVGEESRVQVRALKRRARDDGMKSQVRQRIMPEDLAQPFSIKVGSAVSWTPLWRFAGFRGSAGNMSVEAVITNRNKSQVWGPHNAAGYFKILVQGAEIRLIQKRPAWGFLNIQVQHLQSLGRPDIGGLLGGEGVPEQLERLTDECAARRSRSKRRFVQLAPGQGLRHDMLTHSPDSLTSAEGAQSALIDVAPNVVGSYARASLM